MAQLGGFALTDSWMSSEDIYGTCADFGGIPRTFVDSRNPGFYPIHSGNSDA